jgi:hypothetical protein
VAAVWQVGLGLPDEQPAKSRPIVDVRPKDRKESGCMLARPRRQRALVLKGRTLQPDKLRKEWVLGRGPGY